MRLVVGIGNPGREYAGTRHNVGFEVVDRLAERGGASFSNGRSFDTCRGSAEATVHCGGAGGEKLLLVKPATYVNRTGDAVASLLAWYREGPEALLVVTDCIALDVGTIRIREGGSSAGHRGIESIIASLGTDRFARLRIGIRGSAAPPGDLRNYVLGRFPPDERETIDESIRTAAEAVLAWTREEMGIVMSRFNRRKD